MNIQIKKLTESEKKVKNITNWPIWTKEKSEFDWYYEETEECYIIEGKFIVETDKEKIEIQKGDFVTFPKGLKCKWKIIEPVKKYYNFP